MFWLWGGFLRDSPHVSRGKLGGGPVNLGDARSGWPLRRRKDQEQRARETAEGSALAPLATDGDAATPMSRLPRVTRLARRPRVSLHHGFLSAEECAALIQMASARLGDCDVNAARGHLRTSDGCWIPRSDLPSVWRTKWQHDLVETVEDRIAHATGFPLHNGEPSQIMRYTTGAQYSLHPDFFDPGDRLALANGGQRCATLLIYLSSVPADDGGATFFPRARLRVQPSMGDALLWHNTDPDGRIDPRSVHASEPVRPRAVKWVLSKWLRAHRFTVDCHGFRQEHW